MSNQTISSRVELNIVYSEVIVEDRTIDTHSVPLLAEIE